MSIQERKYDELHELFELEDTPALWAPAAEDEAATSYRSALAARVGDLSPRALLERQRAHSDAEGWPGEEENTAAVLEGKAGAFATPSCLERRLFARQASRYPLIEHPTEFGAFILRGNGRVRVYLSSMDMVGQKIRREVTGRVADDTTHGFRLVAHLHSHPFLLDRKVGDRMWTVPKTVDDVAGTLAPSLADAALWSNTADELALEEGWITNGLDSIHVPKTAFTLFRKSGDSR